MEVVEETYCLRREVPTWKKEVNRTRSDFERDSTTSWLEGEVPTWNIAKEY